MICAPMKTMIPTNNSDGSSPISRLAIMEAMRPIRIKRAKVLPGLRNSQITAHSTGTSPLITCKTGNLNHMAMMQVTPPIALKANRVRSDVDMDALAVDGEADAL